MILEMLQDIINQSEYTQLEFKTASHQLNRDAFDSICGFLNRKKYYLLKLLSMPHRIFKTIETVEETVEEILRLLKKDPKFTVKRLTEYINLSRRGVEYHIAKLKKEGRIERIGPTKGGYWKVIDK